MSIRDDLSIYQEMAKLAEKINSLRLSGNQNSKEELDLLRDLKELREAEKEVLEDEVKLRGETRDILSLEHKYFIDIGKTISKNVNASKSFRDLQKQNKTISGAIKNIEKEILESDDVRKELLEEQKKTLESQLRIQQLQADSIGRSVIGGRTMASVLGRVSPIAQVIGKSFGIIGDILGGLFNLIKSPFEYFDKIDKAARSISTDVGMTVEQMYNLRKISSSVAINIQTMGVSVAEMLSGQKAYNDELGRNITLSREMMVNMSEIALGTDLGADGAGRMAASFESFGYNMNNVKDIIQESFIINQKLGLNSSKVLKSIEGSLKTAQKYSFKDGVKNLYQMAQTAASVKMSMETVFGLSEKLFELEGAVDLSAQLQVLGGSFAALGDPMQLIYQARNDMEGLQKSLVEATKGVAMFDKASGEFKIPAMELHRLRKVAEATGISIDEMTESALTLARQEKALSQVTDLFRFDKEQRESIKNMAQLNKGTGKFEIMVGDKLELLENLSPSNLKKSIGLQNTLAEAAKQRMTFFDKIKNILEVFKSGFAPIMNNLIEALDRTGFTDKLTKVMETISKTIGDVINRGGIDNFLNSLITGVKKFGDFITYLFDPKKNVTLMDVLTNLGKTLGGIFMVAWNHSVGRLGSLLRFENASGRDIMGFDDIDKVNDGNISPNGLVISKPTPMGLKPIAQGHPNDTAYLRKNGMGENLNVNLNGTLKLDLGMGVTLDMRKDLINNPEFRYSILQLISNNMSELRNGTV